MVRKGKRRGRKSNPDAKRRQTTALGQRGEAQLQPLLRRIEAAGYCLVETLDADGNIVPLRSSEVKKIAESLRVTAASPSYPLDMLLVAGQLNDPPRDGEEPENGPSQEAITRAEAGARFALLHWREYGAPPQAQANGYTAPMNDEEAQEILERAKRQMESDDLPLTADQREWLDSARYQAMRDALASCGMLIMRIVLATVVHCSTPRSYEMRTLRTGLQAIADAKMPSRASVPKLADV